ncbi:MAG: DNA translocase FtsK 4TM domain-containing protein [Thermodesulfobacteriota bacterium]
MSKKQSVSPPALGREVTATICLVFGIFVLLCLISFSVPGAAPGQANWGGALGQLFATALMGSAGLSSFWLPLFSFFCSFSLFSSASLMGRLPSLSLGVTGLFFSSVVLLGAVGGNYVTLWGRSYPLGGFLGDFLYQRLSVYLGGPGLLLISGTLCLLSILLILHLTPTSCLAFCWQGGARLMALFRREPGEQASAATTVTGRSAKAKQPQGAGGELALLPAVKEPVRLPAPDDDKEFEPLAVAPGEYQLPSLNLLDRPEQEEVTIDRDFFHQVSQELEKKLLDFGVKGTVVGISPGPVVTTYEFEPAPGVKIQKVVSLTDDLAMGLKVQAVRIVGSIPGKAAMGVEIPNKLRQIVYVRDILSNPQFLQGDSKLTLGLGMDVVGAPVTADLARMPHLLIAGATGAGKSVAINTIICSILLKATPDEVRLLMVDPKRIELSGYEGIPHLLHPVVVDPKMASRALNWAVREMERRYTMMEEQRVKSFASYNEVAEEKMPLIVIIIDELADLMMVSSNEVEGAVARLAQMARAAGMHLILATQRPSVDVLTGLIKANFPTRMSFKVSSKIDSRTILDTSGAEHLLGAGDMLFLPPGTASLQRIHGAYISEAETERIVTFLKEQGSATYDEEMVKSVEEGPAAAEMEDGEHDDKYDEAVALVCESGQASISMVQRRLRIGYNRAARIIEMMEREGIIGPADGAKPREILVRQEYDA